MTRHIVASPTFLINARVITLMVRYSNKHYAIFFELALELFDLMIEIWYMLENMPKCDHLKVSFSFFERAVNFAVGELGSVGPGDIGGLTSE